MPQNCVGIPAFVDAGLLNRVLAAGNDACAQFNSLLDGVINRDSKNKAAVMSHVKANNPGIATRRGQMEEIRQAVKDAQLRP